MKRPAKLVRILLSAGDRHDGAPAYEAIVKKCMELGIAGATVMKGLEGFGGTAEIHKPRLLRADEPIVVTVVDSDENIARLLPEVEKIAGGALIAISDVVARRVERT
jgi:PII-like signaling protein